MYYIGLVKRRQGKFQETIDLFTKSLELDPLNQTIIFIFSDTYILLRDYEKAKHYLDKLIRTIPEWAAFYVLSRAKVHLLENGDTKEAIKLLNKNSEIIQLEHTHE